MSSDGWNRVKAVFHAAADLSDAEARAQLLDRECAGDTGLRREVESLLESHQRTEVFLETPAAASQPLPQQLGAYRLLGPAGQGGMAQVFRAERADGQFQKVVAVKVLRAEFANDDARRRFQRERQVLAELDHPNIVRLWDGGVMPDGRPYLVEDFIDGPPVTEWARARQLDREARIRLFLPALDAMAYAHERGVIHRDVKPGNILTTADGVPKLLDFGIARWLAGEGGDQSVTRERYWTPEYASPEQARGETAGRESDLYSAALVLYELLSERKAYSVAGMPLLKAVRTICEETPDWTGLDRRLKAVLAKALAKDAKVRYQDARQFAADLRRYLDGRRTLAEASPPWRRKAILAAAACACLILGASAVSRLLRVPEINTVYLDQIPGAQKYPALSPDGRRVAFEWQHGDVAGLGVADADGNNARWLTRHEGDCCAAWSPDGAWIAYGRKAAADAWDVTLMRPDGGGERTLGRMEGVRIGWEGDSKRLAVVRRLSPEEPFSIFLASVETGKQQRLTAPPRGDWGDIAAAWSPRGWIVARYTAKGSGLLYLREDTAMRQLTFEPTWVLDPSVNPQADEVFFRASFSKAVGTFRLRLDGTAQPQQVPDTIENQSLGIVMPHGAGGVHLAGHAAAWDLNLWQLPLDSRAKPEPLYDSVAGEETPDLSWDGRRVAFRHNINGGAEIWTANLDRTGAAVAVQPGVRDTRYPRFSPDGRTLVFSSLRPHSQIELADLKTGKYRKLTASRAEEDLPAWSPEGKWVYFQSKETGTPEIWRAEPSGAGLRRVTSGGGAEGIPSHDGRFLYFVKAFDGSPVFRMPAEGGAVSVLPNLAWVKAGYWAVGRNAIWWWDSNAAAGPTLFRYDLELAESTAFATLPKGRQIFGGIGLARDESRIVWAQQDQQQARIKVMRNLR